MQHGCSANPCLAVPCQHHLAKNIQLFALTSLIVNFLDYCMKGRQEGVCFKQLQPPPPLYRCSHKLCNALGQSAVPSSAQSCLGQSAEEDCFGLLMQSGCFRWQNVVIFDNSVASLIPGPSGCCNIRRHSEIISHVKVRGGRHVN